ncbi:MAG: cell wall metabolism sensor histidine kinase WalK [Gammaproteobacteria bacterium]|nr:cell wall metabolism sensor histidine kinase WalK [Gammaproteobacteria bacterium]
MLNKLSNKLILTLLGLLLVFSSIFITFSINSLPVLLQEVNQQLNLRLADNIVNEKKLMIGDQVNNDALRSVFMGLMLVNPMIEVYLINPQGNILAYSAPENTVLRHSIDLAPVKKLLTGQPSLPITGNDPRQLDSDKVFSVAAIKHHNKLQGYLYIILSSQAYDSVFELIQSSYIFRLWLLSIIISLCFTSFAGIILLKHITSRLQFLNHTIESFKRHNFKKLITLPSRFNGKPGDEIDQIGSTFRELSERIIQQVKLLEHNDASRRELIANVSHDLRTPLASLQGHLETLILKQDTLTAQQHKQYLNTALQHSNHLRKLISELFELSRLENNSAELHFEAFSMSELVHDVAQQFNLKAKQKSINIVTNIPQQAAFVSADISLIQRLLENLIENAIKYTPAGGEVAVSLILTENQVTTRISDTGEGISETDLPFIFDRFYRVDKHRQTDGTGLGLAIVKRIIQLHNSTINVNSEPRCGTTLSFALPYPKL